MPRTPRRTCLTVVAVALTSIVAAAPAQAGPLVASVENCDAQSLSQPFLRWADVAQYTLAPGGDLETTPAGWDLGAATVVSGNEPWRVTNSGDSSSLHIPGGTSVTTSAMCVGIEHPTLRFFDNQVAGSPALARLNVEVLFEDATGAVRSLTIGQTGTYDWSPTPIMVIGANLLALMPGERTAVAFRFTADGGDFQIDDVYVDPWSSR